MSTQVFPFVSTPCNTNIGSSQWLGHEHSQKQRGSERLFEAEKVRQEIIEGRRFRPAEPQNAFRGPDSYHENFGPNAALLRKVLTRTRKKGALKAFLCRTNFKTRFSSETNFFNSGLEFKIKATIGSRETVFD